MEGVIAANRYIQSPRMTRLLLVLPVGGRPGAVPYARLDDDAHVLEHGEAQLALLPRAAQLIGLWPAEQLTLLGLQLPAMPAARLQAALAGALEDRLLADLASQHLAAGPREPDGSLRWAACCARAPLAQSLQRLHDAGLAAPRVVPEPALLQPGWACLQRLDESRVRLLWRDAAGEAGWLHLDESDRPDAGPSMPAGLLVEPGLEAVAARWFGAEAQLETCTRAQWLQRAASSAWDLRQFELAPRAAAQRLWASLREQAATPAWRRVGWLAGALIALQLLGLNLHALQLRGEQAALQRQLRSVVAQAIPGAPAVLDPGLQMRRALDQARRRVGAPTSDGIEALMGQAASVLDGARPLALDFAGGRLELRLPAGQASAAARRCIVQDLPCSVHGNTLQLQPSA